jgi:hypothetical protein
MRFPFFSHKNFTKGTHRTVSTVMGEVVFEANWAPSSEHVCVFMEWGYNPFLMSALDRSGFSASCPQQKQPLLYRRLNGPQNRFAYGAKGEKSLAPCWELNPSHPGFCSGDRANPAAVEYSKKLQVQQIVNNILCTMLSDYWVNNLSITLIPQII